MNKDWVSFTFTALKEQGEDMSIIYGHRQNCSDDIQWTCLPHYEVDGIGGFQKLLEDRGIESVSYPVFKGEKPNGWRYLKGFLSTLPDAGIRKQQWNNFDRTRVNNNAPISERLAYHVFSVDETRLILENARQENATANSYLLRHLDQAVREMLVPKYSKTAWIIPVNLRGVVERASRFVPHMSFWAVTCVAEDTAHSIHQRIARLKANYYHYGTWMLFNAGKFVGENGIRKDIQSKEKNDHSWTGTFSNLGSWTLSKDMPWLFGPNVSRTNPIAAGCITTNGRMAFTLQLHAALGEPLTTAQQIVEKWKSNSLKNCVDQHGTQATETLEVTALAGYADH